MKVSTCINKCINKILRCINIVLTESFCRAAALLLDCTGSWATAFIFQIADMRPGYTAAMLLQARPSGGWVPPPPGGGTRLDPTPLPSHFADVA